MSRAIFTFAFAVSFAAAISAAEPPTSDATKERLVHKMIPVADLVTPIPDFYIPRHKDQLGEWKFSKAVEPPPASERERFAKLLAGPANESFQTPEQLMKLITSMVRPYSWKANGGPGKIEYSADECALHLVNTAEAIKEVDDLLDALQRLQNCQIVLEVRVLSIPVGYGKEKIFKGETTKLADGKTAKILKDDAMHRLMENVQGTRKFDILSSPKVTLFDGQTATVDIQDYVEFLTGLDVNLGNDINPSVTPKKELLPVGSVFAFRALAAADHKTVRLLMKAQLTQQLGKPELLPVTTPVTPIFEGGSQGQPIPVTQFLQRPKFNKLSMDGEVILPDNGTVAIAMGTRPKVKDAIDEKPAGKKRGKKKSKGIEPAPEEEVILLVTARMIDMAVEEAKAVTLAAATAPVALPPSMKGPAAEAVAAYRKACAEGRNEDAMRHALRALAADPKCFTK